MNFFSILFQWSISHNMNLILMDERLLIGPYTQNEQICEQLVSGALIIVTVRVSIESDVAINLSHKNTSSVYQGSYFSSDFTCKTVTKVSRKSHIHRT